MIAFIDEDRVTNGVVLREPQDWREFVYAAFVIDALEQALHERFPFTGSGLIRHSDRGSQ